MIKRFCIKFTRLSIPPSLPPLPPPSLPTSLPASPSLLPSHPSLRAKPGNRLVYYIKLQCPFVCLSVPPIFFTRPSDRNQIWHTYSGRCGTHSQQILFDPPHPRGNITSFVTSSNVEHVIHLKTTARRSMT